MNPFISPKNRWYGIKQTEKVATALYARHYSSKKSNKNVSDWIKHGIAGPGEVITLITSDYKALFVWQKQKYSMSGQYGVNCAVFRNEGSVLSSQLILDAEEIAQNRWPGERMFTYIDPSEVRSLNPGYCFQMAGWNYARDEFGKRKTTKRGLLIMEKIIVNENSH